MQKYLLSTLLLTMVLLLSCNDTNNKEVDELFSDFIIENGPGAAIGIFQNGEIIFEQYYGYANCKEKKPITQTTNFRLASITKQFTAACIAMLEEENALQYDNTLKDIFPEFNDYGANITLWQIIHHTSGLIDYEDLIPDSNTVQVHDDDVLKMMMEQDSTYFEPGTHYRYSNSGYALLAMIVQKLSGKSFAQFLNDRIFTPLGMKNTVAYEKNISEVPNRAFGYTVLKDTILFTDQSTTSAVLGDGGIYSSIHDMMIWEQSLRTNKILSKETLEKIFKPEGTLPSGTESIYGFGWRIDTHKNLLRTHHAGSTKGFRNMFHRIPGKKFAVLILTNINQDSTNLFPIAEKLTDMFLFKENK